MNLGSAPTVQAPGASPAPRTPSFGRQEGRRSTALALAASRPDRTGSHEGREQLRFQHLSAQGLVADLRSEGVRTMAPHLQHRGRCRTRCRNGRHVLPFQKRPEDDHASGHKPPDQAAAHRVADGGKGLLHLRRTLRDRAYREWRLRSSLDRMSGNHRRLGRHHDAQRSASDNAATGCGLSCSPAPAIEIARAVQPQSSAAHQTTASSRCRERLTGQHFQHRNLLW